MTKKPFFLIFSIIGILLLSNIFSGHINAWSDGIGTSYLYQTQNAEFQFTTMPSKGRTIEMMEGQFSSFKDENPHYSDLVLYRTFKRDPLKFWNWYGYLANEKYDYPYLKQNSEK